MEDAENDWYSAEFTTFGDRVAGAREALGMSQSDLSRRLGVKLKTIRAWENDLSEPRSNKLMSLSGLLNVSITWLLNAEGDGIDGPNSAEEISPDLTALLVEMRSLRNQIDQAGDRLGRIERALRKTLQETPQQ